MSNESFAELLSSFSGAASDFEENKATAVSFYNHGKYRECIDFIDSCYGFTPGFINRPSSVSDYEYALRALNAMTVDISTLER
jgi:hypothetical protein